MSPATVTPLCKPETWTLADVLAMLEGAEDYWDAHRVECTDCREAATGLCQEHEGDSRMAFLASLLKDGIKTAGEDVAATLIGRTGAHKEEAAALVRGREGEAR